MSRKLLALTFDDGPSADITPQILDVLAAHGVPASFFLVGENITPETVQTVQRALRQGCELCHHSFSHKDMTALTPEQVSWEIEETARRITALSGQAPRFFRPPYIAVSDALFAQVPLPMIEGYGVRDYEDSVSAEQRFAGVMRQAKDGGIILLHDAEENFRTAEAVRRLVPALLAEGFSLVTVSQLFAEKGVTPRAHDRIIYSYAEQTTMYAPDLE